MFRYQEFVAREMKRLTAQLDDLLAPADEVHLNASAGFVPYRSVFEVFQLEIGAELLVQTP